MRRFSSSWLLLMAYCATSSTGAFVVLQQPSSRVFVGSPFSPSTATTPTSLWSDAGDNNDDDIDYSTPSDSYDDFSETTEGLQDGPTKTELLDFIETASQAKNGGIVFGFGEQSTSNKIPELAQSLENTYVLPLAKPSTWKLLYTNAPDVLGIEGGPLSQLISLTQQVAPDTLTLTLTYQPNSNGIFPNLLSNVISDLEADRLTQQVVFAYKQQQQAMNDVSLTFQSTSIDSTRFGSLPALTIPNILSLPSVQAFKIVFNDGDLKIEKTLQGGFVLIYKRI